MTPHDYPSEALAHLSEADPVLRELIAQYGVVTRERDRPAFYALISAIVSQQISVKAAAAIMARLLALFPAGKQVGAAEIAQVAHEELRAVGLSAAKAHYMHDLAEKVASGVVDLEALARMSDEDVIRSLCLVKGIGRWTAEMFLVFSVSCTKARCAYWTYCPLCGNSVAGYKIEKVSCAANLIFTCAACPV